MSVRELIIKKYNNKEGAITIADSLQQNVSTVQNIIRTFKQEGRVDAKKTRVPREKKITEEAERKINEYISADISITLNKIKSKLLTVWYQPHE
ncbi:hypothetical protein GVAV_000642, partial [Gurleya vavrai]